MPPCGVCQHTSQRRCPENCIFAPYFSGENRQKFEIIRQFWSTSYIKEILETTDPSLRQVAVDGILYEAEARRDDKVYASAGIITQLQEQIKESINELNLVNTMIRLYGPTTTSSSLAMPVSGGVLGLEEKDPGDETNEPHA